MKLVKKLLIQSFFAILVPMLIIVFFAVFIIYQNSAISQYEYFESIKLNIRKEIAATEANYFDTIRITASNLLLRDKLYVYTKYWDVLSNSLISYDLESLNDYMRNLLRDRDIEIVVIYRRNKNEFYPIANYGTNDYIPTVLYKDMVQPDYNKAIYKRYPDGIYFNVFYPVFSSGRIVGLIQFMHGYNEQFMSEYSETFGIDYTLISKNVVMFNSGKASDEVLLDLISNRNDEPRESFKVGNNTYSGLIIPFHFGDGEECRLVLYSERINLFSSDSYLIQRLLILALICLMIPVITFFIKELRLIRTINSLLAATTAISSGNYNSLVDVTSRDEMGLLSNNFNDMVSVLRKNRQDLENQNAELSLKNTYIDAVFQSMQINIIVLGSEGEIKIVNKNVSSCLELTEEQYGRDLLSVEPFIREEKLLRTVLDEVFTRKVFTRRQSVKFGNVSYEMDFYPVIEPDQSISAVVLIMNNITERMNMELALLQSDRLASVGELAAGLAHEINNPMSVILNHVQLLQTGKLTDEEGARFLNRAEAEIKRVSKIVQSLLKFSHEEKQQSEIIDADEVIAEVIGLFDPKAVRLGAESFFNGSETVRHPAHCYHLNYSETKIDFYLDSRLRDSKLICARDSFKQIIFNIIKNAFEAIEDIKGTVAVEVEKVPEGILLMVTDNGKGISADELGKVFELFYTRGKHGKGVGLGLPLCRKLMNNTGGTINIESSSDRGTRVSLMFPDREVSNG